jgi:hypothetical protein
MEILAETQQTVETADWQKVQHNNIWATDLPDGSNYYQKPHHYQLMDERETPYGLTKLKKNNAGLGHSILQWKHIFLQVIGGYYWDRTGIYP